MPTSSLWPRSLLNGVRSLYRVNAEHIRSALERRAHAEEWARGAALPEEVLRTAACGFVLSTGRSGTALLAQLLAECPRVWAHHHAQPELGWLSTQAYRDIESQDDAYRLAFLHARLDGVRAAWLRGRAYLETNCRLTFYAPVMPAVFEQVRLVHLVRHPAEFARSALRRGYYSGVATDEGRIAPRADDPAFASWSALSPVAKVGWLWNATNAFIERCRERFSERFITVRSTDLFERPETMREVCEHLGVEPPSPRRVQSLLSRAVNAQRAGEVAPWTEWPEDQLAKLRRQTPLAERYGYAF